MYAVFCTCDLDLDPMTLIYECDLDSQKVYLCTKMEFRTCTSVTKYTHWREVRLRLEDNLVFVTLRSYIDAGLQLAGVRAYYTPENLTITPKIR